MAKATNTPKIQRTTFLACCSCCASRFAWRILLFWLIIIWFMVDDSLLMIGDFVGDVGIVGGVGDVGVVSSVGVVDSVG